MVNHLCTLQVHSKYVADYWVRDVDMLCMALLGDASDQNGNGDTPGPRGVARLGQLVLLVELIGRMQVVRHEKDVAVNVGVRCGRLHAFLLICCSG